jgi:hypothetical protein
MPGNKEGTAVKGNGNLDLHQVPDDKPVYSCQKCSAVIVGFSAASLQHG